MHIIILLVLSLNLDCKSLYKQNIANININPHIGTKYLNTFHGDAIEVIIKKKILGIAIIFNISFFSLSILKLLFFFILLQIQSRIIIIIITGIIPLNT